MKKKKMGYLFSFYSAYGIPPRVCSIPIHLRVALLGPIHNSELVILVSAPMLPDIFDKLFRKQAYPYKKLM